MSEQLEMVYNAFLNNQVPSMWADAAYPSLKPLGSWVTDLVYRCYKDTLLRFYLVGRRIQRARKILVDHV
jgi:hypothetical protein